MSAALAVPSPRARAGANIQCDLANANQCWLHMGVSGYLSAEMAEQLNAASLCEPTPHRFAFRGSAPDIDVAMPPLSLAAATFEFAPGDRG